VVHDIDSRDNPHGVVSPRDPEDLFMFRRRLSVALTLGAALVAISACSSQDSSSPQGTAPAAPAPVMPAPAKLVATIKSAGTAASAVHIKGAFSDQGESESLDVQLNKDGSASGTIGQAGTNIPVVVANKIYYIQFTKDQKSSKSLDPTSDTGKLLLNKWVPSNSKILDGSGMVDGLKQAMDFDTLVPGLFSQFGTDTPKQTGTDTVDGVPVHVYSFADGSTADIESAAPHYLVRLAEPASQGKGQLDFTGWDKPVRITAPSASEIYSGPGA
jgi:hypothetical protein